MPATSYASAAAPVRSRAAAANAARAALLRKLRKLHGWLGLWGAVLGLLFGLTGIVMAHRMILKLPVDKGEQRVVQYRVETQPRSVDELASTISRDFAFEGRAPRVKVEPARAVAWNSVGVMQPERWELAFDHPTHNARVEYFVGNAFAKVEKYDATWIGTLTRLHMAVGVDALWVLLIDSIAASLIVLAVTGTLIWSQLRASRLAAAAVFLGAPALAVLWVTTSM